MSDLLNRIHNLSAWLKIRHYQDYKVVDEVAARIRELERLLDECENALADWNDALVTNVRMSGTTIIGIRRSALQRLFEQGTATLAKIRAQENADE